MISGRDDPAAFRVLSRADITAAVAAREHSLLRRLSGILRSAEVEIAAVASDAGELAVECADVPVDVLIYAVSELGSGFETVAAPLRARMPETRVIVVARRATAQDMRTALENGADAFLVERDCRIALVPALEAVCGGQTVIPRDLRTQMQAPVLAKREQEVLDLVQLGLSNREIAARLYLAESTVKSHLSSAFRKLGIGSRAEARAQLADADPRTGDGAGMDAA